MSKPPETATEWKEILYAPERVKRWLEGDASLADLSSLTGPEMLELAGEGFARFEQGRYAEARTIFEGLASIDPNEVYYRSALGAIALAEDDLEGALVHLREALALDEDDLSARVNRGEIFLRQGKLLDAANDFRRALEHDPQGTDAVSARARELAGVALAALAAEQSR